MKRLSAEDGEVINLDKQTTTGIEDDENGDMINTTNKNTLINFDDFSVEVYNVRADYEVGGENIGYAFQLYDKKKTDLIYYNQEEYNDWRDAAQKVYTSSRYNIHGKKYKLMLEEIQQQRETNAVVEEPAVVEDVNEIVEEKEDEVIRYHYLRNVKNDMTLDAKIALYNDGHAGLRNMFPGISDAQVTRWNKNLERDLIKAGVKRDTKQEYYEEDEEWEAN